MPVAMPARLNELSKHTGPDDLKSRITSVLKKNIKSFRPMGSDVLVASYVQSEVTKGGIYIPDKSKAEDMWQGRAGLILALGPTAFKYRGSYDWEGAKPEVGDWVLFRFADSWDVHFDGIGCRLVDAENIRAAVDNPETVY